MLYVLQYAAIIAAFALPWCIGGAIHFAKSGNPQERRRLILCTAAAAVAVGIIALTVVIAFLIK